MNEADKHYLKFSSPHIYTCSCGVIAHWFPKEDPKIVDMAEKIEYLPCGHAACAKTNGFDCIICAMAGE